MNSVGFGENEGASEAGENFIGQIPSILWQRKWWMIFSILLGIAAAAAAIYLLPTIYRSSAVILVQSPKLPGDLVGASQPDNVDRRVARIREQITSRPDLLALIDTHGLYPGERARQPLSEIVEKMRSAIVLTPAASATGEGSSDKTISFELSFDYPQPAQAQAVAQDLVTQILELDASQNSTQAASTVQFLSDQSNELQRQISALEGQIASISARNGRALSGGAPVMTNSGGLEVQISTLQRENAQLRAQRQAASIVDDRDPGVAAAEAQYSAVRAIYSDQHPDVIAARQRIEEAKAQARTKPKASISNQIEQQIAFNESQIAALQASRGRESAQIATALEAQSRGPLAEQQIAQLQQRLTGLNEQMKSVSGRLLAARAGVRADDEQMGQRLSIVEPPIIPDTPHSPNRLLLGGLGAGGGILLGLLLAFAVEMILRPVRSPQMLSAILGEAPLAAIPIIRSKSASARRRGQRGWFGRLLKRKRHGRGQGTPLDD
ncbi:Wzz/FepE/Etk N-terminal domain-containing protein [Sphingomonas sp. M1-B02]|uniref:Wzz/FepE/Etk N-terminal domain-containing protein n=1 Tax=Sphingomonas sp. M1-B02 TaxID=3114300 RepID=UPI00223ECDD8|nr:Wzz/FepE/Etk N-terminal domain-containing protein [Sphingomonas sp. S6-11]UZK67734.1 Wzz/FepE/Etk N-terminal domain-containing protein [Sphingomonas sp. S6-11]